MTHRGSSNLQESRLLTSGSCRTLWRRAAAHGRKVTCIPTLSRHISRIWPGANGSLTTTSSWSIQLKAVWCWTFLKTVASVGWRRFLAVRKQSPNLPLERTAGSHSLAAAAQRER